MFRNVSNPNQVRICYILRSMQRFSSWTFSSELESQQSCQDSKPVKWLGLQTARQTGTTKIKSKLEAAQYELLGR